MYNIERQEEILKLLIVHKSISVQKLSTLLYTSAPTIRRDLSALEACGKVTRTHGGAVLARSPDGEIPLALRQTQNNLSKEVIAKKAAAYIKDGDVIFMDASSTVSALIPHMKRVNDIVVITNSPKTSILLGEEGIKNYCTGGFLLNQSVAYVGSEAERFLERMNADLCFFSGRGVSADGIITDSSYEETAIRRVMLKNAEKCYFLCDSSKLGKKYMNRICSLDEIEAILCEDRILRAGDSVS